MYTVIRRDGRIVVIDGEDRPVYSSSDEGYIVHRTTPGSPVVATQVKTMTDSQLLAAIANAIKIS